MRNLNNNEMSAVSGALITVDGCVFRVPAAGIPKGEFDVIEKQFQSYIDGNISADAAINAMYNAGVSQKSLDTYSRNLPYYPEYCV